MLALIPSCQAIQVWVAVAACILLLILTLCGVWRATNGNFPSKSPPVKNRTQDEETNHDFVERGVRELPRELLGIPESHDPAQREPSPQSGYDENFQNEDEHTQHPDNPSFVDAWDGEEVQHLNLSRGIEGLKTPLYRLPFAEGQHNDTHAIGLHSQALAVPRHLLVTGGQRMNKTVGGRYNLMMTPDGRPKPLLVHGRPIWRRSRSAPTGSTDLSPYLFFDHTHHTWVFSNVVRFHDLHPLAFLPHGALLPVVKNKVRNIGDWRTTDGTLRNETGRGKLTKHVRYGVPASIRWIRREQDNDVGLTADTSIRVTGDPTRTAPQDFYTLSVQKVFHAREDGALHADAEDDDDGLYADGEDDGDEEEEKSHLAYKGVDDDNDRVSGERSSESHDYSLMEEKQMDIFQLPASTKTRQHFLTHPVTLVYHTFQELHFRYPHAKIVDDPVGSLERNPHPDIETVERQFGDDSTAVAHPLRVSHFT